MPAPPRCSRPTRTATLAALALVGASLGGSGPAARAAEVELTVTNLSGDAAVPGSLPWAVAAADTNPPGTVDRIVFAPGLFDAGPGQVALAAPLVATGADVVLDGPGATLLTVSSASSVLEVGGGTATVRDLTLDAEGDAVRFGDASLVLDGVVVADGGIVGSGGVGGGSTVAITGSELVADDGVELVGLDAFSITGSLVSGAAYAGVDPLRGGALTIADTDSVVIDGTTFSDNTTSGVGGAAAVGGATTVVVRDSTFSHNAAALGGGALAIEAADVTVEASDFEANVADDGGSAATGGALWLSGVAVAVLDDSTFTANRATGDGGAIVAELGGDLTVVDTLLGGNRAGARGGGLAVGATGSVTVLRAEVVGNEAGADAGGVGVRDGDRLEITRSEIRGNRADGTAGGIGIEDVGDTRVVDTAVLANAVGVATDAAGIAHSGTDPLLVERSTIADHDGGGISTVGGILELESSTVADNRGAGGIGGVRVRGVAGGRIAHSTITGNTVGPGVVVDDSQHAFAVDHTVVSDNPGGDLVELVSSAVTVDHSLLGVVAAGEFAGSGNVVADDPMLDPLTDNGGPTATRWPTVGSPVVDAGDPSITGAPTSDQRGDARRYGTIDIGAVERVPDVVSVPLFPVDPFSGEISEADGSVAIAVTRDGVGGGTVSVRVVTEDFTAVAGQDFVAVDEIVTFAPGETGAKLVEVPLLVDPAAEGSESFFVELRDPVGAVIGGGTSIVALADVDGGTIVVGTPSVLVEEGAGSVEVVVQRLGGRDGVATVDVATVAGTAVAGGDYTSVATTLSWSDGEGGPRSVSVPIVLSHLAEPDETFSVRLGDVTGALVGASDTTEVTIADVDGGVVSFVTSAVAVDEDAGSVTVRVRRSGAADGPASVTVATSPGTALADLDFVATTTTLTWAAGVGGERSVSIPILADGEVEGVESFTVRLSGAVGTTIGGATAAVTIRDTTRPPASPAAIVTVEPARLVDTRPGAVTVDARFAGIGRPASGQVLRVDVAGRGGVPADARAVSLNLTVVSPAAPGYLTAYPCTAGVPNASTVNHLARTTVANGTVARLSATGELCIFTVAAAHVVIDVTGYVPADSPIVTLEPARLLDTRPTGATIDGEARGGGAIASRGVLEVPVAGRGGVPDDARAVFVNLTAVRPGAAGFLTLYPCGDVPTASTLNFAPGRTVANGATVRLSDAGSLCVYGFAATDVLLDVAGYVPASAELSTVVPARLLDTRPGATTIDGDSAGGGRLNGGSVVSVQVAGRGGVAADARTAVVNLTVASPLAGGYLTLFPCGALPATSSVNYAAGQVVANNAIVPLSVVGTVCIYSLAPAHVVLDVAGAA